MATEQNYKAMLNQKYVTKKPQGKPKTSPWLKMGKKS
jgi:hypothetical protein